MKDIDKDMRHRDRQFQPFSAFLLKVSAPVILGCDQYPPREVN
jgi:hypothetical protein